MRYCFSVGKLKWMELCFAFLICTCICLEVDVLRNMNIRSVIEVCVLYSVLRSCPHEETAE